MSEDSHTLRCWELEQQPRIGEEAQKDWAFWGSGLSPESSLTLLPGVSLTGSGSLKEGNCGGELTASSVDPPDQTSRRPHKLPVEWGLCPEGRDCSDSWHLCCSPQVSLAGSLLSFLTGLLQLCGCSRPSACPHIQDDSSFPARLMFPVCGFGPLSAHLHLTVWPSAV